MTKKTRIFKTAYSINNRSHPHIDSHTEVQQHLKDSCDINNIMARYAQTGELQINDKRYFADVTNAEDFLSSQVKVTKATEAFNALPAHVRAAFDNSPAVLLSQIADPNHREKCIELGLINPPPVEEMDTTESKKNSDHPKDDQPST